MGGAHISRLRIAMSFYFPRTIATAAVLHLHQHCIAIRLVSSDAFSCWGFCYVFYEYVRMS